MKTSGTVLRYALHMKLIRLSFVIALAILATVVVAIPAIAAQAPTVIYLVRHAEKMDAENSADPKNPHLSDDGVRRASALVPLLADAGVTAIYSTDFRRTIQTVDPLAEHLGLEIETYDPGDLTGFARMLRSSPGRIVVSGHSNTTPALVELLGGEPGSPIDEADEYDRLYILVIEGDQTTTVLLRYGAPSKWKMENEK